MSRVRCNRCGKSMTRVEWDMHTCKNHRDLSELHDDVLYMLAEGNISEDEAWKLNKRWKS